jgi:hypothetical protein
MWKLEKSAEESEAERCMAARGRRLEVEDGGGRALGGSNLDLHDPTSCMVDVTPSHANRVFLLSESFT